MSRPKWARDLRRWDVIEFNRFWEWNDVIFLWEIEWAIFPVIYATISEFKKRDNKRGFITWSSTWSDFKEKEWKIKNKTKCPICKKDREIEIISEDVFKCLTCEHTIYTAFWYKVL